MHQILDEYNPSSRLASHVNTKNNSIFCYVHPIKCCMHTIEWLQPPAMSTTTALQSTLGVEEC